MRPRWLLLAAGVAIVALALVVLPRALRTSTPRVACDRVASTTGSDSNAGTEASPYRTAQQLVDSLSPGMTGCLRGGVYTYSEIRFRRAGTRTARITLTSYPGERATLRNGYIYVPNGSDFVTLSRLNVDVPVPATTQNTIQIMAADTVVEDSDITNNHSRQCLILGNNGGLGQSVRTIIRRNRIHDCGDPAHGNQEHAIYFENTVDARVHDNVFWGAAAYAIHLYPNAQHSLVEHNVIADNGRAVTFSGDGSKASNNNEVRFNLITDTTLDYGVTSWWGNPTGAIGAGNAAHHNCLIRNANGDFGGVGGYTHAANKQADPMYVDRAAHDYRMGKGSPCLPVVRYDTAAKLGG
jgi:hypothetical protein